MRCQEVKRRKLLESPDTASRSRSTTPGLASTPLSPLSPLSNFTGSYSCDATASSESESTVMSQVHIVQLPSQDRDFSCRNQWVMSQKQAQVVRMVACPVQQGQCLLKVSTPQMSETCIFSNASSWYITQHGGGGILIMCRPLIPSSLSHTKSVVIFKSTNMILWSLMLKNVKIHCSLQWRFKCGWNIYSKWT